MAAGACFVLGHKYIFLLLLACPPTLITCRLQLLTGRNKGFAEVELAAKTLDPVTGRYKSQDYIQVPVSRRRIYARLHARTTHTRTAGSEKHEQ